MMIHNKKLNEIFKTFLPNVKVDEYVVSYNCSKYCVGRSLYEEVDDEIFIEVLNKNMDKVVPVNLIKTNEGEIFFTLSIKDEEYGDLCYSFDITTI